MFNKLLHDGVFKFTIFDTFGDGLCCSHGNGKVTILYGSKLLSTPFVDPEKNWTLKFGEATKCPVS